MQAIHGDRRSVVEWDEDDVHAWLSNLGFPQYESNIKEHRISGDILCMLDPESLKGVGISTVGQRLAILKAIYNLKVSYQIPLEPDSYIPPSEASARVEVTLEKLHDMVKEQDQRLQCLEDDNRLLNQTLHAVMEDYNALRGTSTEDPSPLRRQPSFKWGEYKPIKSPTKTEIESPHPSPHPTENDNSPHIKPPVQNHAPPAGPSEKSRPQTGSSESPLAVPAAPKPLRQESTDNLNKSFKVSLEDPTYKVLPAALKKYRIHNDNWENYAMFICYGSPGNRIERCLSYDEKPLLLFQKLKDAKKNPVFMLKHIKDIRSPIVVAQQKHAARKANSLMSGDGNANAAPTHNKSSSRTIHRPPKLEVHDLSSSAPLNTGLSPQPGWPEPGIASPSVDNRGDDLHSAGIQQSSPSHNPISNGSSSLSNNVSDSLDNSKSQDQTSSGAAREMPAIPATGVSYAVAIYPYMAEQDDEFDVVVGDTFVILSRSRGWWVVQRDPTGSGLVDNENIKQGWVPAGCLLETKVPVASAIAEANAAKSIIGGSPPETPVSKTPILPLSIISTSFPGIALMDYKKKGDEELDLFKDDSLRVFKRYNHWSYAVKEDGGDRGWVPSWFIGKVASNVAAPATPNTSAPPNMNSSLTDDQAQISPMSSAFPPVPSRSTTSVL